MIAAVLSVIETEEEKSLFECIYYTYSKQMFFVANGILHDKMLAEDAVQEAFWGIAKQIHLFEGMTERERRAYVLTSAKNAEINLYKKEQKATQLCWHYADDNQTTVEDEVISRQMQTDVRLVLNSAISTLSDFQQEIMMLRYAHGLNCNQIAIALGRKPASVRKELSRARKAFKKACEKERIEIENWT